MSAKGWLTISCSGTQVPEQAIAFRSVGRGQQRDLISPSRDARLAWVVAPPEGEGGVGHAGHDCFPPTGLVTFVGNDQTSDLDVLPGLRQ
jgi:hypothetical protein